MIKQLGAVRQNGSVMSDDITEHCNEKEACSDGRIRKSKNRKSDEKNFTVIPGGKRPSSKTIKHPNDALDSLELIHIHMDSCGLVAGWNKIHTSSGGQIDYPEHEDGLIIWSQRNGVDKKLYSAREIGAAYRIIQRQKYQNMVSECADLLTQPPRGADNFSTMSDFYLGLSEVEQLCLVWWMKDRKRVLVELASGRTPVINQVPMPILYSREQGTGKSFFVDRLCEPFSELVEVKTISEIEDKFNFGQWGKLVIANFDEMAGLDKTDMNLLKQWVFQKKFTKRKMQSELQNHIYRTVGGIGSSNDPINEIVWDSTGTRRFCQIDVNTDGRYIHAARELDFVSVWQSIDHTTMLSDVEQGMIRAEQENQRRKDKIEHWFEECGKLFMQNNSPRVSSSDLYSNFCDWCMVNNEKPYTNTMFTNRIKTIYKDTILRVRSNVTWFSLK